MSPVTQYVFAETLKLSIHFTAGSHEWLPYRVIPGFPKHLGKHKFLDLLMNADSLNPNLSSCVWADF